METLHENPRHPLNDPAFHNRRRPNPENPANDPDFVFDLADRMEEDQELRETVYESFHNGELEFLFHDVQLEMLDMVECTESGEILIFCSRQLGKSFFILCIAIIHCLTYKGKRKPLVRIFCGTEKQVEDIVNDNMQVIEIIAPPGLIRRVKSEKRWKIGRGEIRIGPLSAAHVDGKRGGNATLIITEEGGFVKSDEYRRAIGSVINPQLLRSRGRLMHVTTPSEELSHYIHTSVLPKCKRAGAVANYTVYDNVQLIEEAIFEAFDRCTDIEEWDREYLVKIVKSQTMSVCPEFDEDLHVNPNMKTPDFAYWKTALDFGGVRDPHAELLGFWDFKRAKLCVWDERWLPKNTPTDKIIMAAEEMEAFLTGKAPPKWMDGPDRVTDAPGQVQVDLAVKGFAAIAPEKKPGSWEAGINEVRVAFRQGQIEVHPRCVQLINTLNFGMFNKTRTDFERTDELGHLDAFAALMYMWQDRNTKNPYPKHHGKSRFLYHIPKEDLEPEEALNDALFPDFL